MKKWLLWGVPSLAIIAVSACLAFRWKANCDAHRYGICERLSADKTGSIIECYVGPGDDTYLFVRDFKKSLSKPQFLCYMNYTSTQGYYQARWSKDRRMLAVRDWSSDHFPEMKMPPWVVGYDWQRDQVLHSEQIVSAFSHHGGVGAWYDDPTGDQIHTPTFQEVKQFGLENITPERDRP